MSGCVHGGKGEGVGVEGEVVDGGDRWVEGEFYSEHAVVGVRWMVRLGASWSVSSV